MVGGGGGGGGLLVGLLLVVGLEALQDVFGEEGHHC